VTTSSSRSGVRRGSAHHARGSKSRKNTTGLSQRRHDKYELFNHGKQTVLQTSKTLIFAKFLLRVFEKHDSSLA
jgi:hypothetical protein